MARASALRSGSGLRGVAIAGLAVVLPPERKETQEDSRVDFRIQ